MTWVLNADVGEGFPYDADLLRIIGAANVACGFHAGDESTMREVCALAARHGVTVGAQPSYRDREGFGRRDLEVEPDRLLADLCEQVDALQAAARSEGATVEYLKPHGALYNRSVWDDDHAEAVAAAAGEFSLPVVGLPGSRLLDAARARGLGVTREFFADRAYTSDGRLVPRNRSGAVVSDPAAVAARARRVVVDGTVVTIDGRELPVAADSICVHGDSPSAVDLALAVRRVLDELEAL